jgi:hypothetical protein
MDLFSTNENGKIKTHVHNGQGHSVCGTADDIWEDYEKVLDLPKHNKITCSKCKEQIRYVLKLAKKYGIK